jgi:deazaflavin-dependent oxidoreductase (nitroreductase family)
LARFNRVVTNRLLRPLAVVLPNFGVIGHQGRVSGRQYQTVVNWWRDEETAIVALTYGRDVDWLKNLSAAGGGVIASRGRIYRVGKPVVIGPEGLSRMPGAVRVILSTIDVDTFAVMPLVKPDRPI